MLDKKLDEYVTRVENDAYELGISVGKRQERERIIKLLESESMRYILGYPVFDDRIEDWGKLLTIIKGENDGGINN